MNAKTYDQQSKDIAKMLGESISEYKNSLKILKCQKFKKNSQKNNDILSKLGLTEKDLKKRVK